MLEPEQGELCAGDTETRMNINERKNRQRISFKIFLVALGSLLITHTKFSFSHFPPTWPLFIYFRFLHGGAPFTNLIEKSFHSRDLLAEKTTVKQSSELLPTDTTKKKVKWYYRASMIGIPRNGAKKPFFLHPVTVLRKPRIISVQGFVSCRKKNIIWYCPCSIFLGEFPLVNKSEEKWQSRRHKQKGGDADNNEKACGRQWMPINWGDKNLHEIHHMPQYVMHMIMAFHGFHSSHTPYIHRSIWYIIHINVRCSFYTVLMQVIKIQMIQCWEVSISTISTVIHTHFG